MSISISNESKNTLTITNEGKSSGDTWDEADYTWNEATGTWEVPGMVLAREAKNSLTITNESKN